MTPPIAVPVDCQSVNFVQRLASFGERLAITTVDEEITYRDLSRRVDAAASELGTSRRLVAQVASNTLESLVWYLAALKSGNPLLLLPVGTNETPSRVIATYDPDVIIGVDGGLTIRREASSHDLHPDLALLLSTSGSTGSPKLVRLSHRNLDSNATAIAEYLQIREDDRAATSLPIGYCYGLSVVNSHLAAGAGLVLTDLSVVDECFWTLFKRAKATTFAGVPYTFDLLDRVSFSQLDLPSLRYVTQAGGCLAAERVRALAELGQGRGWDFFVMYGQTEATARMAYLPPDLAADYPDAIGVAIPGGAFSLMPAEESMSPDVGELVYAGPNVMLGYAEQAADLSLGRVVTELRTGDLARVLDNGLYQVVGRRGRFAKLFGKRIDLQQVEQNLADQGITATCLALTPTPTPSSAVAVERLVVVVAPGSEDAAGLIAIEDAAISAAGVAASAIQVLPIPELPRLVSGKVDAAALRELASVVDHRAGETPRAHEGDRIDRAAVEHGLAIAYGDALNTSDVTAEDSFVSLRGDSMSYVELSIKVEEIFGRLPADWHVQTIRELAGTAVTSTSGDTNSQPPWRRWLRSVETNVILRALAMFLVVGSHVTLFDIRGGAHLLIAIAGFNFARFHLNTAERVTRLRAMVASLRRIVIPSMLWMAFAVLIDSEYSFMNVFFLHNLAMPDSENAAWRYWFVEALVYVMLLTVVVLAVPALHRAEQRWPFGFVLAMLGGALLLRYGVIETASGPKAIYTPGLVLFVFLLGWAIAKARTWPQRVVVLALVAVTLPGYSENTTRVVVVMAGLALLLLLPTVRLPAFAGKTAGLIAAASLYIYLTHWQIYPLFGDAKLLALTGSVGFGIAAWYAVSQAATRYTALRMRGTTGSWKMVACLLTAPALPSVGRPVNRRWSLRHSS